MFGSLHYHCYTVLHHHSWSSKHWTAVRSQGLEPRSRSDGEDSPAKSERVWNTWGMFDHGRIQEAVDTFRKMFRSLEVKFDQRFNLCADSSWIWGHKVISFVADLSTKTWRTYGIGLVDFSPDECVWRNKCVPRTSGQLYGHPFSIYIISRYNMIYDLWYDTRYIYIYTYAIYAMQTWHLSFLIAFVTVPAGQAWSSYYNSANIKMKA